MASTSFAHNLYIGVFSKVFIVELAHELSADTGCGKSRCTVVLLENNTIINK